MQRRHAVLSPNGPLVLLNNRQNGARSLFLSSFVSNFLAVSILKPVLTGTLERTLVKECTSAAVVILSH